MRTTATIVAAFAFLVVASSATSNAGATKKQEIARTNLHHARTALRWLRHHPSRFTFARWRARIRHFQRLRKRSLRQLAALRSAALEQRAWAWYRRADAQCVANHEGGWRSTGNPPYAGRFQTDRAHERRTWVGRQAQRRWGPSSNWPPAVQVLHAYLVWVSDSWNSWPTYRTYCA